MKTLEEYVREYGYVIGDFSPDEIERLEGELKIINSGGGILDGVFAEKESQQTREQYGMQF